MVAGSDRAARPTQARGERNAVMKRLRNRFRPTPEPDALAMSPADRELAQIAAAKTSAKAFAPLYEAYVDLVWRFMLSRLGEQQRAADATSLTFQRALTAIPSYQPQRRGDSTSFRPWLMTIARNVVIDESRRARPALPLDDMAAQHWLVDQQPGPEAHAVAADERRRVIRALDRLPEKQRQIVDLRLIGMKGAEIAGMLGMTEAAVKTAHFRAMTRLRDLLAEPADRGNA